MDGGVNVVVQPANLSMSRQHDLLQYGMDGSVVDTLLEPASVVSRGGK